MYSCQTGSSTCHCNAGCVVDRLRECCTVGGHPSGDSVSTVSLDDRLNVQPARTSITSLTKDEVRATSTTAGSGPSRYPDSDSSGLVRPRPAAGRFGGRYSGDEQNVTQ